MALCKDPKLTYLNDLGYNVVKLPRVGIEPLSVLGRDGANVERLGDLTQIWSTEIDSPEVKSLQTAAQIMGEGTNDMKLSVGLKFLSDILAGLGAAVPAIDFAYQHAKKVQFFLVNVKTTGVDAFEVGNYLATGDLESNNPFVRRFFMEDETDALVITEVLKSNSIKVIARDENGVEVSVDVPSIKAAVGTSVAVEQSSTTTTEITYQGNEYLTFGFKAFDIAFRDGDWFVQGVEPDQAGALAPTEGAEQQLKPALLTRSGLVTVK